jgi:aspartyl protease family protein
MNPDFFDDDDYRAYDRREGLRALAWVAKNVALWGTIGAVLTVGFVYRQEFLVLALGGQPPADEVERPAVRERAAAPVPSAPAAEPSAYGQSVTLKAGRGGHFWVKAEVDGVAIDFMVDTGASFVVLPREAAGRAGIYPTPVEFTATMNTANGPVGAAPVRLREVRIGDNSVYDVDALVAESGLETALLGNSFLERLRGFEARKGVLVLTW